MKQPVDDVMSEIVRESARLVATISGGLGALLSCLGIYPFLVDQDLSGNGIGAILSVVVGAGALLIAQSAVIFRVSRDV